MPVMVVGADHPLGEVIARKLAAPDREVRAFISSVNAHGPLRSLGIKVAIGDLSDESHVEAAATSCFTVVFVESALEDGRDLAFAPPEVAAQGWAKAAKSAGVKRVIWVGERAPLVKGPELAAVAVENRSPDEIADEVALLDDLAELPKGPQQDGP
jgi:nucleoside-diphosphate-sugar epimerase